MAQARRLKLRFRVCDGLCGGKIDLPGDCSLEDLKAAVRRSLGVSSDHILELSLNKKVCMTLPTVDLLVCILSPCVVCIGMEVIIRLVCDRYCVTIRCVTLIAM